MMSVVRLRSERTQRVLDLALGVGVGAEVASSRIRMRGSLRNARAMGDPLALTAREPRAALADSVS